MKIDPLVPQVANGKSNHILHFFYFLEDLLLIVELNLNQSGFMHRGFFIEFVRFLLDCARLPQHFPEIILKPQTKGTRSFLPEGLEYLGLYLPPHILFEVGLELIAFGHLFQSFH